MARGRRSNPVMSALLWGVILLAGGIWLANTIRFSLRAKPAVGEVTKVYPCRTGRRTGSCIDISYKTDDGYSGTLSGVQGNTPKGEAVDLLYDPNERGEARLAGPVKMWLGPVAGVLIPGALFGLSVMQLLARRRAA